MNAPTPSNDDKRPSCARPRWTTTSIPGKIAVAPTKPLVNQRDLSLA
jgi:hypothetical protein